jgi:hypothetical protein
MERLNLKNRHQRARDKNAENKSRQIERLNPLYVIDPGEVLADEAEELRAIAPVIANTLRNWD